MQEPKEMTEENAKQQRQAEREKKNRQRDQKKLQQKIDIIKEGEITAKSKYFMEDKEQFNQFYETQYQSFRNPSLAGWRRNVKQIVSQVDEKMNVDKYFIQFLTSIGRVYTQTLIEDAVQIKQSGDFDERVYLTEDHVREAFRRHRNSNKSIDYNTVKKVFE